MLNLERLYRCRVVHVNALQFPQAGELIVVLQNILETQIFAKQLGEGLLVGLLLNGSGIGKASFKLLDHLHKATPRLTSGHIGEAFHVLLVALLQHHVFGVLVTEQGDGINGRLFQIAEGDDVAEGFGGVKNAVGA